MGGVLYLFSTPALRHEPDTEQHFCLRYGGSVETRRRLI